MVRPKLKIQKIHHIPQPRPIDQIAQRPTHNHPAHDIRLRAAQFSARV